MLLLNYLKMKETSIYVQQSCCASTDVKEKIFVL
jgi:hypothetical protein